MENNQSQIGKFWELSLDILCIVDFDNRFQDVNPAFERFLGYSKKEVLGKPMSGFIHPDDLAFSLAEANLHPAGHVARHFENRYRCKDGSYKWLSWNSVPVPEERLIYAIARDVTWRKEAEEQLRQSQNNLNEAQAAAHIGSWWIDIPKNQLKWSDESYRIFGIPQGTPLTVENYFATIHPEDREYVNKRWQTAMQGGEPYNLDYRIVVDSKIKWIHSEGHMEFNKDGPIKSGFGIGQDITERKRAEEALKMSEERFRLSLQNSPVNVSSQDLELLYTWQHNPQLGYSIPEVIGKTDFDLLPVDTARKVIALKKQAISTRKKVREEVSVIYNNQTLYYDFTVEPLCDQNGDITGIMNVVIDITERNKDQERYHLFFNSMLEMFQVIELIRDENGKSIDYYYREVNPAFERLVGKQQEQLIGRRAKEVFGIVEDEWIEAYDKVERSGIPTQFENYGAELDKWYSAYIWKICDLQVAIIFSDITERKKAEERIQKLMESVQQEKDRLSTLVNSIPDEVWFADTQKNFTLANPSAIHEFGFGSSNDGIGVESLARSLEVYRPDGTPRPVEEAPTLRALEGEITKNEEEIIRTPATGELRYRQVSAAPVKDANGNIIGSVAVVRDITDLKKAEEHLKRYSAELEVANKELESYSYSISHDLRTPLRTLDGFSEMVITEYGDKLDETGKNYLNRIRKASKTMSQLTEDILKLSRITRAEMHKERVNLSEMIASIVDELKAAQPERQAGFIIVPDINVNGDKALLEILLRNLLENSWKYSGKCPDTRIEVGANRQDGKMVYFIKDNGVGFDMKYYDKLFQPFQRLHTSKDYPGTGIGLATAARVIHRHSGKIWAESEVGKGTTFYFTLE
jgi:PAS domain S-box-containing protein